MAGIRSSGQGRSDQPEYSTFENALKKVLSVSHAEMQAKLKAEEKRKRASAKRSSASRASSDKR
jgi:hypothetical protein